MQMMYFKNGPKIRFNFNQYVSSSKYSLPLNKQQMNDDIKSNFHDNYDSMTYGMHNKKKTKNKTLQLCIIKLYH